MKRPSGQCLACDQKKKNNNLQTVYIITTFSYCRRQSLEEETSSEVESLKQELSHANELLTSMRQKGVTLSEGEVLSLSPAAAKASAMLKSGRSLTQIYSQYVEVHVHVCIIYM